MKLLSHAFVLGLAGSLLTGLVAGGTSAAQPAPQPTPTKTEPLTVPSGKAVLPLTGLEIDLPKDRRAGATWALSGSWSFTDGGASFDARDVIDQKVDGKIVAGAWVHVGYFNAGDCGAVVKELDVPDRWTAETELWGRHWNVAGGTWDFANELGKVPAVAMCTARPNRASLLLYYFFVADTAPLDQAARLAALDKLTVLERVTTAWEKERSVAVQPMKRPEIRRRGDIEAMRKVHLARSAMDVMLPDDGFAWLARAEEKEATADFLDRMAPAMPDISFEVLRIRDVDCGDVLPVDAPDAPKRKAEGLPKGIPPEWKSLGTLILEDGALERVVCREKGGRTLVVGLLATPADVPEARDFGPFKPLLDAFVTASDATPLP